MKQLDKEPSSINFDWIAAAAYVAVIRRAQQQLCIRRAQQQLCIVCLFIIILLNIHMHRKYVYYHIDRDLASYRSSCDARFTVKHCVAPCCGIALPVTNRSMSSLYTQNHTHWRDFSDFDAHRLCTYSSVHVDSTIIPTICYHSFDGEQHVPVSFFIAITKITDQRYT